MATNPMPALSDELLHQLIWEQAFPVVKRIVGSRIPRAAVEDVCNNVLTDLVASLRSGKEGSAIIRDFQAYAAAAAHHGCKAYFRETFARRYRLRQRLRYLLTRGPQFHLWRTSAGEWLCGLRDPADGGNTPVWGSSRQTAHHLQTVLEGNGGQMAVDTAVEQVAYRLGIFDRYECQPELESLVSQAPSILTELERRGRLAAIWKEICQLPTPQRLALLLNLRDDHGGPALVLLPVVGIASIREIGATLEIAAERLADLWGDLPLDDQSIAGMLGITRQQVINLRKSARERLSRRIFQGSRHPRV